MTDRKTFLFWLGCLSILASALLFYLATVVIRWSHDLVRLDPAFFVFVRFLLGFLIILAVLAARRRPMNAKRYDLLIGRMLANCTAVFCFYKGVSLTTAAQANILNMTYPLFIALYSWFFLKAQRDGAATLIALVAVAGIWLILWPGNLHFDPNHLWGLASGVAACFAIILLNVSRRYHDTETILFYMFGLGTVLIYCLFSRSIFLPGLLESGFLLLCALFGVAGQYLLTLGFRYVTAVEGSIISSTRILLAALLGPLIAAEPALGFSGWIGAVLIFGADVGLALRRLHNGNSFTATEHPPKKRSRKSVPHG